MKFEQVIDKHLQLMKEQEEEMPMDDAAAAPAADPAADPAAAEVDPAAAAPAPDPGLGDVPEESPDVVAMKAQSLENIRKAALMDPTTIPDDLKAKLIAGEITTGNAEEKQQLIDDLLRSDPGDVEMGGLDARPGIT